MIHYFDKCPFNQAVKMADLIQEDYRYLLTLDRFHLPLGFGNRTIGEVCKEREADLDLFLLVVNTLADPSYTESFPVDAIQIPRLVDFLKRTHAYFINYRLPRLHDMLRELVEGADELHKSLLLEFFEKYEQEVRRHMDFEDKKVYPYVIERYEGVYQGKYNIDYYEKHHNDIEKKINDLRNIILKYLPPLPDVNRMNDLLYALFQAEEDLNRHTFIEEHLLFPAVKYYESKHLSNHA
ncbi:MAG: hemerythrin domain-containing protein [Bacteroidales bacterium]